MSVASSHPRHLLDQTCALPSSMLLNNLLLTNTSHCQSFSMCSTCARKSSDGVTNLALKNLTTDMLPLLLAVRPLHNHKTPLHEASSFSPISLTSCACKLLERMVLRRLTWLAVKGGTIPEQLSDGIQRHRSTARAIGYLVSSLEKAKRNR